MKTECIIKMIALVGIGVLIHKYVIQPRNTMTTVQLPPGTVPIDANGVQVSGLRYANRSIIKTTGI